MALRSKLLDEKVVESAKEMLKKVRNNAYDLTQKKWRERKEFFSGKIKFWRWQENTR